MNTNFDCDIVNGLSNALGGRVDLLEKMLGLKVRENLRYSDIQKIVKSGFASEFFDLGDEIMTTYTATDGTEYDFPWLVVDFRDVYWENDPNPHPGMVLQAKYATAEKVTFDAAEDTIVDPEIEQTAQEGWYYYGDSNGVYDNLRLNVGDAIPFGNYSSIHKTGVDSNNSLTGGYNRYKFSAVRQWLNSNADINEWWQSSHLGDVPPAELGILKGFMAELSPDFASIIKETKVKTLAGGGNVDITYDKIFLPSVEEMYGTSDRDIEHAEGPYFQYWKEKTGLDSPDSSPNTGRIIASIDGTTDLPFCWLRTALPPEGGYNNGSFGFMTGKVNGMVSDIIALRVSPCCIIS